MASRCITWSACLRVPLVRISLRPTSCSIAAPSAGWCRSAGNNLDPERLLGTDLEKIRDEIPDAGIDLLPQIQVMRVERVVEIEHPGLDLRESADWTCRQAGVPHGS